MRRVTVNYNKEIATLFSNKMHEKNFNIYRFFLFCIIEYNFIHLVRYRYE